MNRITGNQGTLVGNSLMNLFYTVGSKDPSNARLISANLHGPFWCNIRKELAKMEGHSIIQRTPSKATTGIVKYCKAAFEKDDVGDISLSTDGTKVAFVVQPNYKYKIIVGSAADIADNHCIPIPSDDDDGFKLKAIIVEFHEKKKENVTEIKLAKVSWYQ